MFLNLIFNLLFLCIVFLDISLWIIWFLLSLFIDIIVVNFICRLSFLLLIFPIMLNLLVCWFSNSQCFFLGLLHLLIVAWLRNLNIFSDVNSIWSWGFYLIHCDLIMFSILMLMFYFHLLWLNSIILLVINLLKLMLLSGLLFILIGRDFDLNLPFKWLLFLTAIVLTTFLWWDWRLSLN